LLFHEILRHSRQDFSACRVNLLRAEVIPSVPCAKQNQTSQLQASRARVIAISIELDLEISFLNELPESVHFE
jgi:hypothetical protein